MQWPLLIGFPTVSAGGIWHWPNSPAARPATVFSRVTFQQPGLPEGWRAEPGGTDRAPYHSSWYPQGMANLLGVRHLVTSGPSKLEPFLLGATQRHRCRVGRRSSFSACREDRFKPRIDVPKQRGRTFDGTASLPSSWLLWAVWRRRLDRCRGC